MLRRLLGIAALLLVAGCTHTADPNARAAMLAKPMSEWLVPSVADVATTDPKRLEKDGAALVVVAGYVRAQKAVPVVGIGLESYGDREPATVWLEGPTPFAMHSPEKTGPHVGFGLLVLKPGVYRFGKVMISQGNVLISVGRTAMGSILATAVDDKVEVKAGEVLYLGSFAASYGIGMVNRDRPTLSVVDETSTARAWLNERLPAFAPRLTSRVMPCHLCALAAKPAGDGT